MPVCAPCSSSTRAMRRSRRIKLTGYVPLDEITHGCHVVVSSKRQGESMAKAAKQGLKKTAKGTKKAAKAVTKRASLHRKKATAAKKPGKRKQATGKVMTGASYEPMTVELKVVLEWSMPVDPSFCETFPTDFRVGLDRGATFYYEHFDDGDDVLVGIRTRTGESAWKPDGITDAQLADVLGVSDYALLISLPSDLLRNPTQQYPTDDEVQFWWYGDESEFPSESREEFLKLANKRGRALLWKLGGWLDSAWEVRSPQEFVEGHGEPEDYSEQWNFSALY